MSGLTDLTNGVIIAYVRLLLCHASVAMKRFMPRVLTQWSSATGVTRREKS
jgi:hypothetical protein